MVNILTLSFEKKKKKTDLELFFFFHNGQFIWFPVQFKVVQFQKGRRSNKHGLIQNML